MIFFCSFSATAVRCPCAWDRVPIHMPVGYFSELGADSNCLWRRFALESLRRCSHVASCQQPPSCCAHILEFSGPGLYLQTPLGSLFVENQGPQKSEIWPQRLLEIFAQSVLSAPEKADGQEVLQPGRNCSSAGAATGMPKATQKDCQWLHAASRNLHNVAHLDSCKQRWAFGR